MEKPTFKRSKRIIALHYGADSFKTRRLCLLFPNPEQLPKNEAIVKEAFRIINLRRSLGFEISDAGIDAAMAIEVQLQKADYIGSEKPRASSQCVACKELVKSDGWLVGTNDLAACAGDCTLIANFYYSAKGSKLTSCATFKNKYGRAIDELSPAESFDAMLSYMLHLTAHRTQRQQRYAEQRNPTHGIVQTN